MRLPRRALLLGLASASARAGALAFGGPLPAFVLTLSPGERMSLSARAHPGSVTIPAARAHIIRQTTLADDPVALVAFAADAWPDATCDLIAVVGADALGLRLMALEPLAWRDRGGAHLATDIAITPDQTAVVLRRVAAEPDRGKLLWRREAWTDVLRWRHGQPMADAPMRATLPGTWQAALSLQRRKVRAALDHPRSVVDEQLLADARTVPVPPALAT